jgi:hypothetical protein
VIEQCNGSEEDPLFVVPPSGGSELIAPQPRKRGTTNNLAQTFPLH